MSKFFEDTMQGLLEAVEKESGNLPVTLKEGMSAPTYYVAANDSEIIDKLVQIRKAEKVSQAELALRTGNSQQEISRFERKTHSVSIKFFSNILNALGYEVQLIKKI